MLCKYEELESLVEPTLNTGINQTSTHFTHTGFSILGSSVSSAAVCLMCVNALAISVVKEDLQITGRPRNGSRTALDGVRTTNTRTCWGAISFLTSCRPASSMREAEGSLKRRIKVTRPRGSEASKCTPAQLRIATTKAFRVACAVRECRQRGLDCSSIKDLNCQHAIVTTTPAATVRQCCITACYLPAMCPLKSRWCVEICESAKQLIKIQMWSNELPCAGILND